MKAKRVVLSISGGLLLNERDGSAFKEWSRVLLRVSRNLDMMCVVAGGGSVARDYIAMAEALGLGRDEQDMMGIAVTRVNALLLSLTLGWNRKIPESYEEAGEYLNKNRFLVCGGMVPRQSTDKVAADMATIMNADLVLNATKVDGVYNKNPSLPDAELLRKLSYDELKSILKDEEQLPGKYALFDLAGIDVLKKSRIPLVIFNGANPENLEKILEGEDIGTLVV